MKESNPNDLKFFNDIIIKLEGLFENEINLKKVQKQLNQLKKNWKEKAEPDNIPDNITDKYDSVLRTIQEKIDWLLWSNLSKKEEICVKLEKAFNDEEKQSLLDHYKDLRSEWRSIGPIPREKKKEINDRYDEICGQINEKCRSFFKELDLEKEDNLHMKETLCNKIENLKEPKNWKKATEFVQKIQKNWNSIGPVPNELSDDLWEKFQTICNDFFERKRIFFRAQKEKNNNIINEKQGLCEQVEKLKDSTDWKKTSSAIKELQNKWNSMERAPYKIEQKLFKSFKSSCDQFYKTQKQHFKELEKELPSNLEKKQALCEIVENLEDYSDNEKLAKIKQAQSEWKEIGPVPKEFRDSLWKRFRKPIDEFFDKRNRKFKADKRQKDENATIKEKLCEEAEALSHSKDWKTTSSQLKELQEKWKSLGPANISQEKLLWHRFHSACDLFFKRLKEDREKAKVNHEENILKKRDLCIQAEIISEIPLDEKQMDEKAKWQLEKLSENFFFKVIEDDENSRDKKAKRLIELQKEWKEIGPTPKGKGQELWERFNKACNYFFQKRNK